MHTSRSKSTSAQCNQLYSIVKNALPICQNHSQICQMYDQDKRQFTCAQCNKNNFSCLTVKDILLNSTLLMQNQTNERSSNFLKTQMQRLSKLQKNYRKNNQMLDEYFRQIEKQIKKFTNGIKDNYKKNQQNMNDCSNLAGQIRQVCSAYNNYLIQQLENQFQEGTTEELLSIFQKFSTVNQNPFLKIQEKINNLAFQMQKCSNIDWKKIQSIYQRVTDPFLWQVTQVIIPYSEYILQKKSTQDKIYLPNNPPACLSDFEYLIKATQKQIQLLKQIQVLDNNSMQDSFDLQSIKNYQSKEIQSQLKSFIQCSNIDMIYELPERKLLTLSYDKLQIYCYKFEELVKQKKIQLSGCTEVLVFQNQIILLVNENIYKVNYKTANNSSLQKIQSGYSSINYLLQQNKKCLYAFLAINQENQKRIMNL